MTEIRKSPITGKKVIVAVERGMRPSDFKSDYDSKFVKKYVSDCPFCPGNEEDTPLEVCRINKSGEWIIRVIPNKYAALSLNSNRKDIKNGLYQRINGLGFHEIIVESPKHNSNFFNMSVKNFKQLISMYKQRYNNLIKKDNINYISIYKNYLSKAGATKQHPHSQIIALEIIPELIKKELRLSSEYYFEKQKCIFCEIIKKEIMCKERVVTEKKDFIVLAPYVSTFNYELMIIPKKHDKSFGNITPLQINNLAETLKDVFGRFKKLLGNIPFNLYIHSYPTKIEGYEKEYHWHIIIAPRLAMHAGFEISTEMYINTISPKRVAQSLKDIQI